MSGGFWSSASTAAPQWWRTLFPTRPGFLRTHPAPPPVPPANITIRRAGAASIMPITAFWNACYRGADWYMDVSVDWVARYVNDPDVLVFYAHDAEYNIRATIVSSPVSPTPVVMTHGARTPLRCIEGLCVHEAMRGHGLAGTMIAAVDAYTSASAAPVAHMWSRELPTDPGVFTTAASVKTYAYFNSAAAPAPALATPHRVPWHAFVATWNPYRHTDAATPAIISETPLNRNQGIDVWSTGLAGGRTHTIAVLHTQRRSAANHAPILEIIWSSHPPNMDVYAAVSARYTGAIVFTTDADESWAAAGWVYGRSGVHATYVYNYLPPVFRNCEFIMLREEI
jgi:hypothetical protein